MKTHELIAALSAQPATVDPGRGDRLFGRSLALSLLIALGVVLLGLGPLPLDQAGRLPVFWLKLGLPLGVAVASFAAMRRLAHPGRRAGAWAAVPVVLVGLVWVLALAILAGAPAGRRWDLVMADDWLECLVAIVLLSVPAFLLSVRALRALAPTRLRLTGAMAGLFAGSLAAAAFTLHCPVMQVPYLAVWYVLGMFTPAVAGALVGRKLLRW